MSDNWPVLEAAPVAGDRCLGTRRGEGGESGAGKEGELDPTQAPHPALCWAQRIIQSSTWEALDFSVGILSWYVILHLKLTSTTKPGCQQYPHLRGSL